MVASSKNMTSLVVWCFCCIVGIILPTTAYAQNANVSSGNQRFYPENVTANTERCTIPPRQVKPFQAADAMCENVTQNLLQDEMALQRLAEAHAPFLYFHPLEQYTMSSVNRTFGEPEKGTMYFSFSGLHVFEPRLNQTSMMRTTRDRDLVMFSHLYYFQRDVLDDATGDEYKFGDGFDARGESVAPIYFRPFDSGNGTITIHYFMYYTWTGPTNLGILTSFNASNQYVRLSLPPWGVHEGGWEAMSVTVCKHPTPSQPLGITYRQRGFGQMLDCTKGECTFHKDSPTNPVGFVALNSHNVYPFSVRELVYAEAWPLEFWVNLQAVLLVERVAYADRDGAFRRFSPKSATVKRFWEQSDIPDNVNETDYWMAFGGRWGRSSVSSRDLTSQYPTCLTRDTLGFRQCPSEEENPTFLLVMELLGVNRTSSLLVKAGKLLTSFLTDFFAESVSAPLGPPKEAYYSRLNAVGNADIWKRISSNTTGAQYCRSLIDNLPDTPLILANTEILPLVKNVIGIIVLVLGFTIMSIAYFIFWKAVERARPVLQKDEEGKFLQPRRTDRQWVYTKAWLYTAAWLVAVGGAVLFFVGYDLLLKLLQDTFPGLDFSAVTRIFYLLGVMVLIIDTLLLIAIWLRSDDLWLEINERYFDIVGDDEGMASFRRFKPLIYHHGTINAFFVVAFSLVLLSLIMAVIMVVIGMFNVGFSFAFGHVCRFFVGAIDGICVRFPALGMREIKCGADFHKFCSEWAQREMVLTLWGAFLVAIGHYFLICAGGMAVMHNRLSKRALALLPSREEYAQGLTHPLPESFDPSKYSQLLEEKEQDSSARAEDKEADKAAEPTIINKGEGQSEEHVIEFHSAEGTGEDEAETSRKTDGLSGMISSWFYPSS